MKGGSLKFGAVGAGFVAQNFFSAAAADDEGLAGQLRDLIERRPEEDAVLTGPELRQPVVVYEDLWRIGEERAVPEA